MAVVLDHHVVLGECFEHGDVEFVEQLTVGSFHSHCPVGQDDLVTNPDAAVDPNRGGSRHRELLGGSLLGDVGPHLLVELEGVAQRPGDAGVGRSVGSEAIETRRSLRSPRRRR
jgi:hypothetical protein